jgi:uncharacterized protein (DUF488 family)
MQKTVYTFGYEGLALEAFLTRLGSAGVKTVIDVRANPLSRKPGFSKRSLSEALDKRGIAYRHAAAMGCPKPVRDRYKRDGDWAAYTRGFLAHLSGQSAALAEVVRIAKASPSCLICFEADFNRCHRMFVARAAAQSAAFQVNHLTAETAIPDGVRRSAA